MENNTLTHSYIEYLKSIGYTSIFEDVPLHNYLQKNGIDIWIYTYENLEIRISRESDDMIFFRGYIDNLKDLQDVIRILKIN